ncbi:DsrE/DsrF/DrsH-like family protein [Anaerostipes sp.]|uniref:DsrE/DsrF/DrsH-like family protein n=1 Tax=Anaerostipes sp. TaxID=1872530 RepID=UPI0025BB0A11|nr:DsrE/DsrF/DrsH-like family protein [Anaerostipes sp.]MBS7006945.1 DsrE/DsrF/DrsH-like family protein [Anaerostipes sp.]
MNKKTVIIGGVAGGATAAARLRRKDESMEIVLLERGEYISYANCGLPYHVGDVIKSRESLLLQTPEAMKKKFGVDVRVQNEAVKINADQQTVTIKDRKTGREYEEEYDFLVIASGSSPVVPPIPGIDGPNIYTLWTVPDTDRIKQAIKVKKPKTAAVIGGGFIGIEMAENLQKLGIQVRIIEMQDQVMAPLDFEMAQLLHENIETNGVELILGDGVSAFHNRDEKTYISLNSGKELQADMVLLSIGVRPNSELAGEAGLKLNKKGGILVDEMLRTSVDNIFAVGDVIEVENYILKEPAMIPLAGPANKQGRICADNIAGGKKTYKGTLGTSAAQVFDLTAAAAGVNEKTLVSMGKKRGKDFETVLINQKSHAGYYPGAVPITLKLLFDLEGRILGAQAVGQEGVDKRMDVLAAAMRSGDTIYDLEELELAYAPPYSSAKDPVNMLGFTAENVLEKMVSFMRCEELDAVTKEEEWQQKMTILDVTEDMERMVFHIPGSVHIPLGQLRQRIDELPKDRLTVVYCAVGVRSYNAARVLMQNGFLEVKVLEGGTSFYQSMHYRDRMTSVLQEEKSVKAASAEEKEVRIVDCCGLQCPGPIMKVHETLQSMEEGEMVKVSATDMGFPRDIESWCQRTGNTFVRRQREGNQNIVYVQKGTKDGHLSAASAEQNTGQGKTMVIFSGDMDKALASFIIANGAAAMGRPVTMFFTFWGLNILRKPEKQKIKKSFVEKMFGAMMPRGSSKLKLSKMNMGGMGTKMMKRVMREKNVETLENLMKQAVKNGVKLVACTMSMDVMGIRKEEIIDGVDFAGVASYLGDAENSDVNLFI